MSKLKAPPPAKRARVEEPVISTDAPTGNDVSAEFPDEEFSFFEKRILTLAKQFPKGLPNKIIQNDSPTVTAEDRAGAINNLLGKGLLDLYKQGNELLYKVKTPSAEPAQMKGADEEEKVVYDIIATAENKGIWIRDIRFKSNLTMPQLNKVLKTLEVKRLIKTVKSVAASKKKVYMLFDLEPDRSLTGGAFYSDQDFEQEFVIILNQQCYRFLESKREMARLKKSEIGLLASRRMATATQNEIWEYIKNLGISKVELSMEDIESILDTLIYDDKIDMVPDGDTKMYYSRPRFGNVKGLDSFPCGVCPVFRECTPDGPVNPTNCVYMTNWLNIEIPDF